MNTGNRRPIGPFLLPLFGLVISSSTAWAGPQATYYVDPANGSDASSGTSPQAAFRTLQKAQNIVRGINTSMTGDIVVYLRNGTFSLTSPLQFAAADSGTNGHSVIYQAYPNEHPVISGGRDLSESGTRHWTLADSSKNIYRLTNVFSSFRQLFVNGQWAIRARQPNLTSDASGGDFYRYDMTPYPYSVPSSYVGSWASAGTAEMVWTTLWSQYRGRIAGSTTSGPLTTLTFKSPENAFAIDHNSSSGPGLCYFENAYAFLDAPGEWFLNKSTRILYYIPRPSESMTSAKVTASGIETLFNIEGTASAPAHHLQFIGLTFADAGWNGPDNYGFVDGQAGFMYQTHASPSNPRQEMGGTYAPVPGMLEVRHAHNILVSRSSFVRGGAWGIVEFPVSHDNVYLGNLFSYLAAGGIAIGGRAEAGGFYGLPPGSGERDIVRSNLMDHVPSQYRGAVPIFAGNVKNTSIMFNEIRNAPYSGISIGWEWNDLPNYDSHDNMVGYNRIHNVMQLLTDGAGIYTLGRADNTFIDHNYIYNVLCGPVCAIEWHGTSLVHGIYLDSGSAFKTISNNVTDDTYHFVNTNMGLPYPPHDNTASGNYYNTSVGATSEQGFSSYSQNHSSYGTAWPEAAVAIMDWAGVEAPFRSIGPISRGSNLSVRGTASASSTYHPAFAASYAIDNNTEVGLWASDGAEANPWWLVDLGGSFQVFEVDVEDRRDLDQPSSRANFDVRLYAPDHINYSTVASVGATPAFDHLGVYPAWIGSRRPVGSVGVVRTNSAGHFNFAEVKVFGLPLVPSDARAGWVFDGSGSDVSGHGFDVTLYGAASYSTVDPKDGTASLSIPGTGSFAGGSLVTSVTDNVTLSTWAKWDGTYGDMLLLYNGHSGYNGYGIILWTGNSMKLTVLCGGVGFLNASVGLQPGRWSHIAAVRRGGIWELWVDGSITPISSNTLVPGVPNGPLWVGMNFTGLVDSTRIYERALSVGELQALAME